MRTCFLLGGVSVTMISLLSSLVVLTLSLIGAQNLFDPMLRVSNDQILFGPHIYGIPCGPYEEMKKLILIC